MHRPYTIIVSEVTVDGKLTLRKGRSSKEIMQFMDDEANRYLHELRAKVDGIMVGAETIRTDNPFLTVSVDLIEMMDRLYKKGIKNLMVEGGSTLNWNLIRLGLVDEIRLIHIPFIVGGTDTPTLVGGEGFYSFDEVVKLKLRAHFMRGSHLITEWEIKFEG